MKPATVEAAYDLGFSEGEDGISLSAWPSPSDLVDRDAITRSWCRGWKDGRDSRRESPAWIGDDDHQRSDAAPNL